MRLDLEELAGKESYDIPGFIERLLAALPGVHDHHCAKGRPGGFVERLYEGTYFGHIVEHVCLELTDRAGISVNRGKTVLAVADRIYDVAAREILKIVADHVNGGPLLVATLASSEAMEQWESYRKVFQQLGVKSCSISTLRSGKTRAATTV